eukprot:Clim_evm32s214 gene=Clim_evmTU32s214
MEPNPLEEFVLECEREHEKIKSELGALSLSDLRDAYRQTFGRPPPVRPPMTGAKIALVITESRLQRYILEQLQKPNNNLQHESSVPTVTRAIMVKITGEPGPPIDESALSSTEENTESNSSPQLLAFSEKLKVLHKQISETLGSLGASELRDAYRETFGRPPPARPPIPTAKMARIVAEMRLQQQAKDQLQAMSEAEIKELAGGRDDGDVESLVGTAVGLVTGVQPEKPTKGASVDDLAAALSGMGLGGSSEAAAPEPATMEKRSQFAVVFAYDGPLDDGDGCDQETIKKTRPDSLIVQTAWYEHAKFVKALQKEKGGPQQHWKCRFHLLRSGVDTEKDLGPQALPLTIEGDRDKAASLLSLVEQEEQHRRAQNCQHMDLDDLESVSTTASKSVGKSEDGEAAARAPSLGGGQQMDLSRAVKEWLAEDAWDSLRQYLDGSRPDLPPTNLIPPTATPGPGAAGTQAAVAQRPLRTHGEQQAAVRVVLLGRGDVPALALDRASRANVLHCCIEANASQCLAVLLDTLREMEPKEEIPGDHDADEETVGETGDMRDAWETLTIHSDVLSANLTPSALDRRRRKEKFRHVHDDYIMARGALLNAKLNPTNLSPFLQAVSYGRPPMVETLMSMPGTLLPSNWFSREDVRMQRQMYGPPCDYDFDELVCREAVRKGLLSDAQAAKVKQTILDIIFVYGVPAWDDEENSPGMPIVGQPMPYRHVVRGGYLGRNCPGLLSPLSASGTPNSQPVIPSSPVSAATPTTPVVTAATSIPAAGPPAMTTPDSPRVLPGTKQPLRDPLAFIASPPTLNNSASPITAVTTVPSPLQRRAVSRTPVDLHRATLMRRSAVPLTPTSPTVASSSQERTQSPSPASPAGLSSSNAKLAAFLIPEHASPDDIGGRGGNPSQFHRHQGSGSSATVAPGTSHPTKVTPGSASSLPSISSLLANAGTSPRPRGPSATPTATTPLKSGAVSVSLTSPKSATLGSQSSLQASHGLRRLWRTELRTAGAMRRIGSGSPGPRQALAVGRLISDREHGFFLEHSPVEAGGLFMDHSSPQGKALLQSGRSALQQAERDAASTVPGTAWMDTDEDQNDLQSVQKQLGF